jgi:predicted nucleic acid-binding protein
VVAANLGRYDGSTGVLVDTNIWVDCIDSKSPWHDWAIEQLQVYARRCTLI